jgi:energy-coupling factor transport system ATP-binding protein
MTTKQNNTFCEEFLVCRDLTFYYPDDTVPTLRDVSFSLNRGEIMVVCGESGCGKTTLLRHMKKNQHPFGEKTGQITCQGRNLEELSLKESVELTGFVGQNPEEQLVTDTVWHELAFVMENLGYPSSVIRKKTGEIAQYFGIGDWFRQKVSTLSGGQKQLLNLASVMVTKPELLVLDEPTAQLDPISAERFLRTLLQLNLDFGTTILMAEQRLEFVLPMAHQVMFLHQGENVSWGEVQNIPSLLRQAEHHIGTTSPVREAFPVALRVYLETETGGQEENIPLSVGEGRRWLQKKGNFSLAKTEDFLEEKNVFLKKKQTKKKASPSVLTAKDISFSYGNFHGKSHGSSFMQEKKILEHFSLQVSRGEIYGIVGGNGSGKTTALKLLCGVLSPEHGKIKSTGRVLYLAQNPKSIFTELTVWEELGEAFSFRSDKDKTSSDTVTEMTKKIESMLQWLELDARRDYNPMDLSGGEQQRLALGKILLMEPDILLLDEPTKGMDGSFKQKFSRYLRELSEKGMTILLVTHDLEFCARNATRCGFLFDGTILSESETKSFFEDSTFYTTQARRMTEGMLPHCVLWEDIVETIQSSNS